jgi:hypothetical protein
MKINPGTEEALLTMRLAGFHNPLMTIRLPTSGGRAVDATPCPYTIEIITDPGELARANEQEQRYQRNRAWLEAHASEVFNQHRGRCICIAGEELFVADTPEEAWALAEAAHPEDNGAFIRYIPREKVSRIYAS